MERRQLKSTLLHFSVISAQLNPLDGVLEFIDRDETIVFAVHPDHLFDRDGNRFLLSGIKERIFE